MGLALGLAELASVVLAAPGSADSDPDAEKIYVVDCDGDCEVLDMPSRQPDLRFRRPWLRNKCCRQCAGGFPSDERSRLTADCSHLSRWRTRPRQASYLFGTESARVGPSSVVTKVSDR